LAKQKRASLESFQYAGATKAGGAKSSASAFKLSQFDPADKPFSRGDKERDKQATAALATELDGLQELFYADRRYKLLVVLQGTDTSGKDGTIRGVFGEMSALGVHTASWKGAVRGGARARLPVAHPPEGAGGRRDRDLQPESTTRTCWCRSVSGALTAAQTRQRYDHINDFERMLTETGTVILKFLLHISKDEQRQRLQDRIDDPTKRWKFAPATSRCASAGTTTRSATSGGRGDRHAVGAVDHRAGRFEDAPQPDGRDAGEADPARPETALPAGRSGAGDAAHRVARRTTTTRPHRGDRHDRPVRRVQGPGRIPPDPQGALRHRGLAVRRPRRRDQHHAAHPDGMGAEVIHLGHNRSVDEVVTAALQEDAHGIAISSYQGGHVEYFKYMVDMLKQRGGEHVQVFGGGGGVIVRGEIAELQEYGVSRIYSPEDGQRMGLAGMIGEMVMRCDHDLSPYAPKALAAIEGRTEASWRALSQLITALENGKVADRLKAELHERAEGREDAGARHHRHRRRRQVEPDRRADPAPAPRPGRPPAHRGDLDRSEPAQDRRRAARRPHRMNAIGPWATAATAPIRGPRVYMRSLATRDTGSEISQALPDVLAAAKCAGFDLVIVETSGIGQGDAAIVPLVDVPMYVMTPEFGARASSRRSTCSTSPSSSRSTSSTARAPPTRCATSPSRCSATASRSASGPTRCRCSARWRAASTTTA
jgi:methylmalonyl-CoA mutase cobalamin-binding domain/chain